MHTALGAARGEDDGSGNENTVADSISLTDARRYVGAEVRKFTGLHSCKKNAVMHLLGAIVQVLGVDHKEVLAVEAETRVAAMTAQIGVLDTAKEGMAA
jgi:hypothetical protein